MGLGVVVGREQFLVAFADAVSSLASAADIVMTAAELLGRELRAAQVAYAEIDSAAEYATVERAWGSSSVPPTVGRHRLVDFGPDILADLKAGLTVVIADTTSRPTVSARSFARLAVRSVIEVPLVKNEQLVAVLSIASNEPRLWTDGEVQLCRDVAERTWAVVERARVEEKLGRAQARLASALDAGLAGTFYWDVVNDRLTTDTNMQRYFSLPDTALRDGVPLARVMPAIHEDDRARVREALRIALDQTGVYQVEHRVWHSNGELRWLSARGSVERGRQGAPSGLSGFAVDVTRLKNAEDKLKEVDRRKDEFLAVLSHELRNPLAPLRTGLELIRLANNSADVVAHVRPMMERQINHMVRLVDDLLDVSRIASGKIRLHCVPTPLADLVHMAVEAHRSALDARKLALTIDLPETPVMLNVDPTRFVQVLSNVLHNAVKFTEAHGMIAITAVLERHGDVVITIADTGTGISPSALPRVFDLFAQGDAPPEQSRSGLGIGLALARRLVEMHHGSIEARSEGLGKGSAFAITIPVATTERAVHATSVPTASLARRRVLVIDDNVDGADALGALVRVCGGECRIAYNGFSGVEIAREFQPDIVLLDIGMPGMDGYETCKHLRSALGRSVVVLAISGWAQERDKELARGAGFDAHLTKPVDPSTLQDWLAETSTSRVLIN